MIYHRLNFIVPAYFLLWLFLICWNLWRYRSGTWNRTNTWNVLFVVWYICKEIKCINFHGKIFRTGCNSKKVKFETGCPFPSMQASWNAWFCCRNAPLGRNYIERESENFFCPLPLPNINTQLENLCIHFKRCRFRVLFRPNIIAPLRIESYLPEVECEGLGMTGIKIAVVFSCDIWLFSEPSVHRVPEILKEIVKDYTLLDLSKSLYFMTAFTKTYRRI